MGTIKDIVDMATQLANSVEDRRVAAELNNIQKMILAVQSEQAAQHEKNMALNEERNSLLQRIRDLEAEVVRLKSTTKMDRPSTPTCPNCSLPSDPVFMRPVPRDFVSIQNATHECPKCGYLQRYG